MGKEQGENGCWMDTNRTANSPSFGNWGIFNAGCYEPVTTALGSCKALITSLLFNNTSSLEKFFKLENTVEKTEKKYL